MKTYCIEFSDIRGVVCGENATAVVYRNKNINDGARIVLKGCTISVCNKHTRKDDVVLKHLTI